MIIEVHEIVYNIILYVCSTVHLTVRTGTVPWSTTTTDWPWPTARPAERQSLYKHYKIFLLRYRRLWPRPLYSRSGQSKLSPQQWTFGLSENRYLLHILLSLMNIHIMCYGLRQFYVVYFIPTLCPFLFLSLPLPPPHLPPPSGDPPALCVWSR